MLNINISVADMKSGFPNVTAIHRVRHTGVGDFETALNSCIDQFDAFSKRLSDGHVLKDYADEIMSGMAQLEAVDNVMSVLPKDEYRNVILICAQDKV